MFAFGAWLMAPLQGAAARCCCKVLVSECCLRFGAWLLLPLQVPLQGAAAGCRCRVLLLLVPLQSAAAEARWSLVAGASSLVLLQSAGASVLLPLQGVAARCLYWSGVCALELGY